MAAYCHLGIYALRTFSRNDMDVVQSTSQPLSYLLIDPPLRAFSLSIDISERLNGGGGACDLQLQPKLLAFLETSGYLTKSWRCRYLPLTLPRERG